MNGIRPIGTAKNKRTFFANFSKGWNLIFRKGGCRRVPPPVCTYVINPFKRAATLAGFDLTTKSSQWQAET
jgi:hypothetical protein